MGRLTIEAGTFYYDFPQSFDIVREQTVTRVRADAIVGAPGAHVRSTGNMLGPKRVTVRGLVQGSDAATMNVALNNLLEVQSASSLMQLTDNTLSHHAEVWLEGVRVSDRHHAFTREITLTFLIPSGTWHGDDVAALITSSASIDSTKLVRYVTITNEGNAPTRPKMVLTPSSSTWPPSGDGEVIWRSGNLMPNGSLDEGVGVPTGWTALNNPEIIQHFGRTSARCVLVKQSGSDRMLSDRVPIDAGTEYTASMYALGVAGAPNIRLNLFWYDAAEAYISNDAAHTETNTTSWARVTNTATSPATAAFAALRLEALTAASEGYITDIQLEQAASASTFINTSVARFKPKTFALESPAQLTQSTGDALAIDHELGRTRLLRSGSWQENNDEVNGNYFDLLPGINHIQFTAPTAGNLDVEIRHREQFL